ncbi:hypothetical protein D3C87_1532860 [compost metagenome]
MIGAELLDDRLFAIVDADIALAQILHHRVVGVAVGDDRIMHGRFRPLFDDCLVLVVAGGGGCRISLSHDQLAVQIGELLR